MILVNFSDIYPDKGLLEIINPLGESYIVTEHYCRDSDCDCRKVRLVVLSKKGEQYVFDYGWETFEFYKKWMYGNEETAKELVGLSIDSWIVQPKNIDQIFEQLQIFINGSLYENKFEKHYDMMKSDDYDEDKEWDKIDKKIDNHEILNIKNKKLREKNKKKLAKKQRQKNRKK